ncbi:MAG: D-alanyl-D-alanine carboxypeptidase DacA [Arsenophonus endosymbiont of Ceratovacuna japonica]
MKYTISSYYISSLIIIINIIFLYNTFSNINNNSQIHIIPSVPNINSKAYILIDYYSGKILAEKKADQRHEPASLTKMMTSYVIGQEIKSGKISMNDIVTINENAWATGNPIFKGSSLMFLTPGDHVSVSQLIRGINLQSGNDACVAMAEYIAGDEDNFVKLMNEYARYLKLKNTHFITVHGLDAIGQYSSAHDMALIGKALIHDIPEQYSIYKEKEFTFNKIKQLNRNNLLWDKSLNVDGIKTGNTNAAGYNLVASATKNNMRLISVILGSHSSKERDIESKKLLHWGFRFFETIKLLKSDIEFIYKPVWFANNNKVKLGIKNDLYLTIPRNYIKHLKITYILNNTKLQAPLEKNQIVGTINIQLDGKIIEQHSLIVLTSVNEGGFFSKKLDSIKLFFNSN